SEVSKGSECDRDQQHAQDRHRPPPPTLFSFTGKKGKEEQRENHQNRTYEQHWSFERRRKQREQGIEPQEKVIGLWYGLDDRRIRLAGRSKWAEIDCTRTDGQNNRRREEQIFPYSKRNERRAVLSCQFVVFIYVGCSLHNASWHRPFVDTQLQ